MKFCSKCGHELIISVPPLDTLPRHICPSCHSIFYQNPKIVVCSIPMYKTEHGISVLLCRRAIEPRALYWTLPGGFMENGETTSVAAIRETKEEAGANVEILQLSSLMNLSKYNQVHLFYLAQLNDLNFNPGEESLEVKLFTEEEIPWNELAFSTITNALKFFFNDIKMQSFQVHTIDLDK